ncbi:hypothetical protein BD779DRAFT_1498069 [Infundibulicybe gibba]|nr:hypothetical protein BD779DRAFT_1498069 [Infundibulicybe gibba]
MGLPTTTVQESRSMPRSCWKTTRSVRKAHNVKGCRHLPGGIAALQGVCVALTSGRSWGCGAGHSSGNSEERDSRGASDHAWNWSEFGDRPPNTQNCLVCCLARRVMDIVPWESGPIAVKPMRVPSPPQAQYDH